MGFDAVANAILKLLFARRLKMNDFSWLLLATSYNR